MGRLDDIVARNKATQSHKRSADLSGMSRPLKNPWPVFLVLLLALGVLLYFVATSA